MEQFKPKILSAMKSYSKEQFRNDMIAGIIVAIIALPLSIAFALGAGVSAEKGIYSAIISSFIVAILGGSRVQITGPTGAFIIITQSIIASYGLEGLMIAMVMAGIMLLLMGAFQLGKLIKYIPTPITIGFTAGIGVTIFTLEIKDFLGLTMDRMPANFIGKWSTYFSHFREINWQSILLGSLCIIILIIWPKINTVIPNSLIAIIVGTLVAFFFHFDVKTLGDIPKTLAMPPLPNLTLDTLFRLIQPAFTISILVAMQALLSAVVTDSLTNKKHNANMELIAEGIANIVLGFLGCIPATGGVARSIANVKNGGKTPIATIFHGLTLFLFLILCMPLLRYVPLCVLSAILIVVAYNMMNVKAFILYLKAPKSDFVVLLASCILTFAFDLVLAIEVGMVLTCVLFVKRMSDTADVYGWKYIDIKESESKDALKYELDDDDDPEYVSLKQVPAYTQVFEISGPMFFGDSDKLISIPKEIKKDTKTVILRMSRVTALDFTALNAIRLMYNKFQKSGITLMFSHVMDQPASVMKKAGFINEIGHENFCDSIHAALTRAEEIG